MVVAAVLACAGCGSTGQQMRAANDDSGTTADSGGDAAQDQLPDQSACRQDGLFTLVSALMTAVDHRDAAAVTEVFAPDARWSVYDHFGSNALTGSGAIGAFTTELGQRGDHWTLAGIEPPQEDLDSVPPVATSVIRVTVTVNGTRVERRAKITVDCADGVLLRMAGPHSVS